MRFNPLHGTFLGVETAGWLALLALLIAMIAARFLARAAARRILRERDRRRDAATPSPIGDALVGSSGLCAAAAVGAAGLSFIDLTPRGELLATRALAALAIIGAMFLGLAVLDASIQSLEGRRGNRDERVDRLLLPMARKFVRVAVFVVAGLSALGLLGVNVAGVVAGLGITGLVVALAAKDSVENVFGSFTILFDMPFALGDHVKIDKYEGTIEEINLRSTRIRTFEDSIVTLPNSNLIRASVENFGARRHRRQRLTVQIGHISRPDDVAAFCSDLRAWLIAHPAVDHDRVQVEPNESQENWLGILVQAYFEAPDMNEEMRLRGELLIEISRLRALHHLARPGQVEEPPTDDISTR